MRTIIAPVPAEVIARQLQHCRFLKLSRRGNFELYLFRHRSISPLLLEIGRLRELSFRNAGSGTGKSYDLDEFDTGTYACQQLIAWDPQHRKIAGGYRLQHFMDAFDGHSRCFLPSAELFDYSPEFVQRYLPNTMEAGRSWIHPEYQSTSARSRSIFVLDSLIEGVGAVTQLIPGTHYLFGKVSVPRSYPTHIRDLIIGMLNHYFGTKRELVVAKHKLKIAPQTDMFYSGLPLQRGLAELRNTLGFYGYRIPPLINTYLKLGDQMLVFDSTINSGFGNVPDTAIMHEIAKMYPEKRERYFNHSSHRLTDVA